MPVVAQLQAMDAAPNGVFEIEFEGVLDVLARSAARSRPPAARARGFLGVHAAEERLEEVGKRAVAAGAAKHLLDFVGGHGAIAALAAAAEGTAKGRSAVRGAA